MNARLLGRNAQCRAVVFKYFATSFFRFYVRSLPENLTFKKKCLLLYTVKNFLFFNVFLFSTKSVIGILVIHVHIIVKVKTKNRKDLHFNETTFLAVFLAIDPDGRCFHAAWAVSKSVH